MGLGAFHKTLLPGAEVAPGVDVTAVDRVAVGDRGQDGSTQTAARQGRLAVQRVAELLGPDFEQIGDEAARKRQRHARDVDLCGQRLVVDRIQDRFYPGFGLRDACALPVGATAWDGLATGAAAKGTGGAAIA